jgi:hypothetical protein
MKSATGAVAARGTQERNAPGGDPAPSRIVICFFCRNGSSERRKKAGEEEKGSESQGVGYPHPHYFASPFSVSPPRSLAPVDRSYTDCLTGTLKLSDNH